MDDLGFILASWLISLGSIALLAIVTVRRSKKFAARIPDNAKPWL